MASTKDTLNTTQITGYKFAVEPDGGSSSFPSNAGLSVQPSDNTNAFLYPYHSIQDSLSLIEIANTLVNPRGKGIYATDEAPEGIDERLAAAEELEGKTGKVWSVDERRDRRKQWRVCLYGDMPTGMFYHTWFYEYSHIKKNLPEYISGVILHSETLLEFNLAPLLLNRNIIAGVRADLSTAPLPSSPISEPITTGLDDLFERLRAAHHAGARFSKWRAPILCNTQNAPTREALEAQAENLARFAAISQRVGLVPIVEPDVAFDEDASLVKSLEVHVRAISLIFERCVKHGVLIEGILSMNALEYAIQTHPYSGTLIKPSFPQPGLLHPSRATISADEIAEATATMLTRALPVGVAGVVFLSGIISLHFLNLTVPNSGI